ncbi:hypothetical protein Dimus_012991, partial [Dionaea muscipula]
LIQKGTENVVADHLSRLPEPGTEGAQIPIKEEFPGEQLCNVEQETSAPEPNPPEQVIPSVQDLTR